MKSNQLIAFLLYCLFSLMVLCGALAEGPFQARMETGADGRARVCWDTVWGMEDELQVWDGGAGPWMPAGVTAHGNGSAARVHVLSIPPPAAQPPPPPSSVPRTICYTWWISAYEDPGTGARSAILATGGLFGSLRIRVNEDFRGASMMGIDSFGLGGETETIGGIIHPVYLGGTILDHMGNMNPAGTVTLEETPGPAKTWAGKLLARRQAILSQRLSQTPPDQATSAGANPPGPKSFWRVVRRAADFDGDGLSDWEEVAEGSATSPSLIDSNFDGITDAQAAGKGATSDSDKDGLVDDEDAVPWDKLLHFKRVPDSAYAAVPLGVGEATHINGWNNVVIHQNVPSSGSSPAAPHGLRIWRGASNSSRAVMVNTASWKVAPGGFRATDYDNTDRLLIEKAEAVSLLDSPNALVITRASEGGETTAALSPPAPAANLTLDLAYGHGSTSAWFLMDNGRVFGGASEFRDKVRNAADHKDQKFTEARAEGLSWFPPGAPLGGYTSGFEGGFPCGWSFWLRTDHHAYDPVTGRTYTEQTDTQGLHPNVVAYNHPGWCVHNTVEGGFPWPEYEILEPSLSRSPVGVISGIGDLRLDSISPMRQPLCGSDVLLSGGQNGKTVVYVREGLGWQRTALADPAGVPMPDPVLPLKWNARGEALVPGPSPALWRNGKKRLLSELGAPSGFSAAAINKNGWICGSSWTAPGGYQAWALVPVEVQDLRKDGPEDDLIVGASTPPPVRQNGESETDLGKRLNAYFQEPLGDSAVAWIDPHRGAGDSPDMPRVVLGFSKGLAGLKVKWRLEVEYLRGNGYRDTYVKDFTRPDDKVVFPALPPGSPAETSPPWSAELDSSQTWNLFESADWRNELTLRGVFGGTAKLFLWISPVAGGAAPTTPVCAFRIGGKNPDQTLARAFLNTLGGTQFHYLYAIARHETFGRVRENGKNRFYNQFYTDYQGGLVGDASVDMGWAAWAKGWPLYNLDRFSENGVRKQNGPGGYGMFQLTLGPKDPQIVPTPNAETFIKRKEIWNWQDNARGAVHELSLKLRACLL